MNETTDVWGQCTVWCLFTPQLLLVPILPTQEDGQAECTLMVA